MISFHAFLYSILFISAYRFITVGRIRIPGDAAPGSSGREEGYHGTIGIVLDEGWISQRRITDGLKIWTVEKDRSLETADDHTPWKLDGVGRTLKNVSVSMDSSQSRYEKIKKLLESLLSVKHLQYAEKIIEKRSQHHDYWNVLAGTKNIAQYRMEINFLASPNDWFKNFRIWLMNSVEPLGKLFRYFPIRHRKWRKDRYRKDSKFLYFCYLFFHLCNIFARTSLTFRNIKSLGEHEYFK